MSELLNPSNHGFFAEGPTNSSDNALERRHMRQPRGTIMISKHAKDRPTKPVPPPVRSGVVLF